MFRQMINGFCMALADSVPGVSGGTIAFIMGFYDSFIGAIHDLSFGGWQEKKKAIRYLAKLALGWVTGMVLAVLALSSLFESHIYVVSSLFIGFIAGSIPLVIKEEKESISHVKKGIVFCLIGIAAVVAVTWANGSIHGGMINIGQLTPVTGISLFFIGMIAISAMFLPGISGSTLLLIFGAYIPVIQAVKATLSFDLHYIPGLFLFGCGVLAGAVTVVKVIKVCLERFRTQTVYMILGMMIGSIYAIIMGPTTLEVPAVALNLTNFQWIAAILGVVLVLGIQVLGHCNKERAVLY